MTAEIAILNKSAVALAADSAVTIGRGASAKIYNSVNKIFELHETAPVGIMVYGRLDFMGLPLETVIKQYRRNLGGTKFPKISDYCVSFIDYLSRQVKISDADEGQIAILIASDIIEDLNTKIDESIFREIRLTGKYLKSRDNPLAQEVIDQKYKEIDKLEKLDYANKAHITKLENKFGTSIDFVISRFLNKFAPSKKTREAVHRLVILALTKKHLSNYRSGIVIAGFGEDELCPSLERFEMEGVLAGRLKFVSSPAVDVGRHGPHAEALGFAQSDMIERFMHGIDPDLYEFAQAIIRQSIEQIARELITAFSGSPSGVTGIPATLVPIIDKIRDDQLATFESYKTHEYTQKIFDMIRHMPKQELANLARALIELTSLKRKVSREQETVGGEVDVAVISKSEGLVWVKRKHYFPSELNSRFFAHRYSQ